MSDTNTSAEGQVELPREVCLLTGRKLWQGLGTFARRLAIGLIDDGYSLSLVVPYQADVGGVPDPPVRVFRRGPVRWPVLRGRSAERVAAQLAAQRPALIHALDGGSAWLADRLSERLNVPYVVSMLGMREASRRVGLDPERCAALLPASDQIADVLRHRHAELADRVRITPVGTYVRGEVAAFQSAERIPSVLAIAPLTMGAGAEIFVRAVARLVKDGFEAAFALAGTGSLGHGESQLWRLARGLKIHEHLTFVDTWPLPEPFYEALDLFVQPNPQESWDESLLEAMACGAVVVGCEGGVHDLLRHQETAWVVPAHDVRALADAMAWVLSHRDAARELAAAGQRHVREHHSVTRVVAELTMLYREVLLTDRGIKFPPAAHETGTQDQ